GKLEVKSEENKGAKFFFSINLHKSIDSKERVHNDFSKAEVAYITLPSREPNYKNLKIYIEYIGAKFKIYSYKDILELEDTKLPNIIFIDHQYIEDQETIGSLLHLNTKIVLISTAEIETCKCPMKEQVDKIIYKPINYSKTLRVLKLIEDKNIENNQTITKVKDSRLTQAFKGIKALVVEDNIINQKLIYNLLNNFHINVTIANNGLEALNLRKQNSYDIIFMDIQMPIMSGVESTQKIIEYEKEVGKKHVPIVALTANAIQGDKEKYIGSGMDKYLKKPINLKELISILEESFPINEIRDAIPLENHTQSTLSDISKIILYKETALTAKIYSAILNNLGYKVDMYSSEAEFISHLDNNEYKFALFDIKPFRVAHSDDFLVNLIRDSGATPIAFVEDNFSSDCETLNSVGSINEISQKLKECG
ncbi:MAG TPA: response regulator, partial [Campylobacterales bacterium]|nr:response regulator [Campylobacterales bacterium]